MKDGHIDHPLFPESTWIHESYSPILFSVALRPLSHFPSVSEVILKDKGEIEWSGVISMTS